MMKSIRLIAVLFLLLALILSSCSPEGVWNLPSSSSSSEETPWTWISGSNTIDQVGIHGKKNVAAASNIPGARSGSVSWIDSGGNLWLFGGNGYDSTGYNGNLNDLWKFDGTNWTWVSGSNTINQVGIYGKKGVAAASNIPGARSGSVSWIDSGNNLWLFGGNGHDSTGYNGNLNDLWKFDGTNWTWVSGSNTINQVGIYATQGTAYSSNIPGARSGSVSWIDSGNNLWLFGGNGYDSTGYNGNLNDLWKFDGTNWTWVNGSNTSDQVGIYGTKGVAAASNIPGARSNSVSWIDSSNNLWLFGGYGYDSAGTYVTMNDLWKFDGTNWTWMSGSNTIDQVGIYGTKGVAAASNIPGARSGSVSWIDSSGNLWLFGGAGYMNDLWRYQP
jgi:N-acetylneuraminic acid mutarotase